MDVTFNVVGNVYSYDSDKLWLAYGIAVGASLLAIIIGHIAIMRAGASFTADFSTITRIAKNADITADMQENRLPGKYPLPKQMSTAKLCVRTPSLTEGGMDEKRSSAFASIDLDEENDIKRQSSMVDVEIPSSKLLLPFDERGSDNLRI